MRSLIVDDDFITRQTLAEMLTSYGVVDQAANAMEASHAFSACLAEQKPYDLVCVDIRMPAVSGHDLVRNLRAVEAEAGRHGNDRCKVIMISAHKEATHVFTSFRNQADSYLVKPVDADKLLAKLKELRLIKP
jgi:two-component system chemotaxis response regulator CheY